MQHELKRRESSLAEIEMSLMFLHINFKRSSRVSALTRKY